MYSVFLVEDEIVMRDGIRELIAWNEYGFSFAGEASDGELAWPQIQKLKPDIVITDIKMPFMDGLALSRLVRKEFPRTTIIILSGYDDFVYAKEAISIGVNQYLLKPLSRDQLVEILCEVKLQKDKEAEQARYLTQFNSEIQEYLSNSRRGFFDQLVSGKHSVEELLARAERLKLPLSAECYNVILFLLEEDPVRTEYSAQMADVQSDICGCFPENKNLVMFSMGIDLIVFLVMADASSILLETESCVECIREICQPIRKTINWSVVVSTPVNRLSGVADCYRAARKGMFYRHGAKDGNIFYVDRSALSGRSDAQAANVVDFDLNDTDAAKMDQRIVEKFLISGLPDELTAFVGDYFRSIGTAAVQSLIFRQYVVLNINFTVKAFLEKYGYTKESICSTQKKGPQLQESILSLEASEQYVRDLLQHALELRDQAVNSRYTKKLQKAVDYIKNHYSDPEISLNTVAKVAIVSPTHFSAVFSQQMGKTFVEYLTELRMEKAKELLRCTDTSSSEIAYQVGYSDPHYFSFIFKKINGCSPRDYRMGRKAT